MDTGPRSTDLETRSRHGDSPEWFTADLQALRRQMGGHGYKVLARRMGLGHGSVHAALTQGGKLPSEYVLERMIAHWAPETVEDWLARRASLAAPIAESTDPADPGPAEPRPDPVPTDDPPTPRSRSLRRLALPLIGVLWAGGLVGAVAPIHAGGVDMWEYCITEYGDQVADPPTQISDAHAGWDCVLVDGRRVAADMSKACRDQHPPLTRWGRTFVEHTGNGATTWRCVTSQLALLTG